MNPNLFMPGSGQPVVSLVMIVKDEEAHLDAALCSSDGLAGEIVLCDTGSTDRTVEIAKRHGARVIFFEWTGSFADARNFVWYTLPQNLCCLGQTISTMANPGPFETEIDLEKGCWFFPKYLGCFLGEE